MPRTTQPAPDSVLDTRWAAVVARDPEADGRFVFAVRTTGIYCRPSCKSRQAKRENVAFFDSPEQAEQAGFRACKRCRPKDASQASPHAALIANLCRLIEQAETEPTLEELATHAGFSPYHLHRLFKAATGVTPKQYALAHRSARVRQRLPQTDSVTEALHEAGYSATSFYTQANQVLGMTPRQFRNGGHGTAIHYAIGNSTLGLVLIASSQRGICAILMGDESDEGKALIEDLCQRFPNAAIKEADAGFADTVKAVVRFVETPKAGLDLPLDIRGTAFQQRVWQALRAIPPGETASYTDIAARIGSPKAVRAVASACAANPLAVAVPCHRILRNDGGLSGYRWGIERKKVLLEREAGQAKDKDKDKDKDKE